MILDFYSWYQCYWGFHHALHELFLCEGPSGGRKRGTTQERKEGNQLYIKEDKTNGFYFILFHFIYSLFSFQFYDRDLVVAPVHPANGEL